MSLVDQYTRTMDSASAPLSDPQYPAAMQAPVQGGPSGPYRSMVPTAPAAAGQLQEAPAQAPSGWKPGMKKIAILIVIALVVALAAFAYWYMRRRSAKKQPDTAAGPQSGQAWGGVNYFDRNQAAYQGQAPQPQPQRPVQDWQGPGPQGYQQGYQPAAQPRYAPRPQPGGPAPGYHQQPQPDPRFQQAPQQPQYAPGPQYSQQQPQPQPQPQPTQLAQTAQPYSVADDPNCVPE